MGRTGPEWDERYRTGRPPWELGRPDRHLVQAVEDGTLPPGRFLDLGCGTGDAAIWLAQRGLEVVGADVSETAIDEAREKAAQAGVEVEFHAADLVRAEVPGGPFDLAFDRGCYHSFDDFETRRRFAGNVARHLVPGGLWLSISGSTDDPPRDMGPPRRSATDLVTGVEPEFMVVRLEADEFDANRTPPPRAWILLLRRRAEPWLP